MAPVRIALFTPYSPTAGGAGTNYRSLLPHLRGAEIKWFYLSNSTADYRGSTRLGPLILGGPMLQDAINSVRLFIQRSHPRIDDCVQAMLKESPDIVWVDAINEGLIVGKRLLDKRIKHLHVSVHDDPAGLAIKSRRYRPFAPFIDSVARDLLKRAHTVDTASEPMQDYYQERLAVSSGYVYRYIEHPIPPLSEPADKSIITIGHVGNAYSAPEVFAFLQALRAISDEDHVKFRLINFGTSSVMAAAEKEFPEIVQNQGNVAEPEVIKQLQQCAFVYAMYSFNPRHRIFRETSQPTKISTYLMAAKPIFVHSPAGSSTMQLLSKHKLGLSETSMEIPKIANSIRSILNFQLDREQVLQAAEHHCGNRNLEYLNKCFGL
jgi:hypothetical protein